MRLKTYHGATIRDVMKAVRTELGHEALIVSTLETDNGVRITAALEKQEGSALKTSDPKNSLQDSVEEFVLALKAHGLPEEMIKELLDNNQWQDLFQSDSVWDVFFSYSPLMFDSFSQDSFEPIMLVGSPGAGKSVTIAKLATQALLSGRFVHVMTSDSKKAGAVSQLKTYMEALGLKLTVALTTDDMKRGIQATPEKSIILIDTPGINTCDTTEVSRIANTISSTKISPIWVCPAGEHPDECLDKMTIFQSLGCKRMLISKLDMVRRAAGALSCALDKGISLVGFSNSPLIADEIIFANSHSFREILTNKDDYYGQDLPHDQRTMEEREAL